MNDTTPITYEQRRQNFIAGAKLLGGQRATAEILDIAERTMRALVSGDRHIHDGHMQDLTFALEAHARACRELAKLTDPLFVANRVPPPPLGGAAHKREKADG
jgi:hypothetical protein